MVLPKELQELFQKLGRRLSCERGDFVYHQGREPEGIYLLESGLVGLVSASVRGKERLVRLFKSGQILSHRALLAQEPYHASAKVLEKSILLKISIADFNHHLEKHPSTLRYFVSLLAKNLGHAEMALSASNDLSVTQRVAENLIYLIEDFPEHHWTRQEIAEFSGTTAPTVFRVMAYFEDQGLIQAQRRHIKILNREKLLSI